MHPNRLLSPKPVKLAQLDISEPDNLFKERSGTPMKNLLVTEIETIKSKRNLFGDVINEENMDSVETNEDFHDEEAEIEHYHQ